MLSDTASEPDDDDEGRALNHAVTSAIIEAERHPDGSAGRAAAYRRVAEIEEQIAVRCPASSIEGWIARRGVIMALASAGDLDGARAAAARHDVAGDELAVLLGPPPPV